LTALPLVLQINSARKWIGEAAHVLELAGGLAGRGWPVAVVARQGSPLAERARGAGLRTVELAFQSRFRPRSDLRDARLLAELAATSPNGVLLHCHRGKDHWTTEAARVLRGLRAPLLRSRHVVTPLAGHICNRWLFRRAAAVICVSRAALAGFCASGRLPEDRVSVIPSGSVDLERFRPVTDGERREMRQRLGLSERQRAVVLVGRMQGIKGHRPFLAAAAQVAGHLPDAVFLLVGDGGQRAAIETHAAECGIRDQTRFLGRRDDVPDVLAACDLGIVASLGSEGFSRAALEYMGAGLPVVATRVGALPEIVADGITGRLVGPGDPEALAAAMTGILSDPPTAAAKGRAGRERAERDFSRRAWLDAHEALYRKCLASGRGQD
jgi:glycosyltransferase involved in cell wall biosynthesis